MLRPYLFILLIALAASACGQDITFDDSARDLLSAYDPNAPDAAMEVDVEGGDLPEDLDNLGHGAWDGVVGAFVIGQCFDYDSLQNSSEGLALLQLYVDQLGRVALESTAMSGEQRAAMWINAYNALVVFGVVSELGQDPDFRVDADDFAFFQTRQFNVGGLVLSLDLLEHGILRDDATHASMVALDDPVLKEQIMEEASKLDRFDPRIHFAVNCASTSCPGLRAEAYQGDRLDAQLAEQSSAFLDDATKGAGPDGVSMLFSWFRSDFEVDGSVEGIIDTYRTGGSAGVDTGSFLTYDWSLNSYDPALTACQER